MHCTADLVDIAEATKGKVCIIKPDSLQPAGFSSDKVIQAPAAIEPFPPLLGTVVRLEGVALFLFCFFFTSLFLIGLPFVSFSCV